LDFGQRVASNLPSQKPFRHAGGIIRAFEQLGDIPKLPNNPLPRPKSSKRHYSLVISLSKVQIQKGSKKPAGSLKPRICESVLGERIRVA
jgi:hypothetical protein